MVSYVATPTSRKKIRVIAQTLRKLSGLEDKIYVPIIHLLELWLPIVEENFTYEVVSKTELDGEYAVTYPEQNKIAIREDVYERACNGVPRDRFTIAHEIGHLLLHSPGTIKLARGIESNKVPAYKDPEWQANTFAAELLAPPSIINGLSKEAVVRECGVSLRVGEIQLNNS